MRATRRQFLQGAAAAGVAVERAAAGQADQVSPNDKIRFATIGIGGMGSGDTRTALSIPGNELVAVCDVYDGRLTRAREVFGNNLFTTRDHREILSRKDVDAVIIATPDHWHAQIAIDALNAGKDVYLQKPMVQKVEDGRPLIEAEKKSGRILQVGSQYVSSIIYAKTRELIQAGVIGELNMVEAWLDRNTATGAWQYSIPPDASPENIDWDRFLGNAPKHPFEPIRLFRWRNYRDYGTAVAGDLFVHLLSGLHVATGSLGPNRVFATGGLRYWMDGRDVPDVMLALLDYPAGERHPAFNLALRVNFKCGLPDERFGFRFVGSEGTITAGSSVVVSKTQPESEPGYTIGTFPKAVQEEFLKEYRKKYPQKPLTAESLSPDQELTYAPPPGYNAHLEHHKVFWSSVRSRKPVVEDTLFGFRAAGPALLSNVSYFEERVCKWDPQTLEAS
ncbi:MAG TPA: Gfo/Idh/MocA family oxidoreductase [Bryobacteraceae bacterium]|nr:Gfo/Idh/MocA family oxidoreductase [Bryobacteraceae bacterium]